MSRSLQRFLLASAVVAIGALIVLGLFFITVPEANQRIMDLASGIVLGWGAMAMSYYFGTSESSAHKTDAMERMAADIAAPCDDDLN